MQASPKHGSIQLMSVQEDLKSGGPDYLLDLYKEKGNVFWLDGYLFAFDPFYVNEVYVKQYNNFVKAAGWHKMRKGIGNGLLTNEEPQHLAHRRILNPAFHISKINSHINKMYSIIEEEIKLLEEQDDFKIADYFLNLSYKVLTNTLFDDKDLASSREFKDIFYSIMEKAGRGEKPGSNSLDRDRELLYELISKVIEKRNNSPEEHNDFLDLLIESATSGDMTIQDVVDETLSMLLAGHETTASIIVWAICHSSVDNDIIKQIKLESNSFKNNVEKNSVLDSVKELKFSEYVINETLRLYPPVWSSPRKALNDCQIADTFIPKDTRIILSSYVSHRDSRYFYDPFNFIPRRWENGFEETLDQGVYFPFHIGQRKCIGYRFGMIQAQITLLEFLNRFTVHLSNGMPSGVPLATYRPNEDFAVTIKKDIS